ncbi:MAG: YggS family pyridoxal phosphate-dependent enzyme [Erysipelotrichales bacterium]|nr:YggS family pyridoxal phosphate-dependent enzyme [Erysipelotrichales bacterium]
MEINKELIFGLKEKNPEIKIVAATKYVDSVSLLKYYEAGIRDFGENRVADFLKKYESFKNHDVKWHFIGHLQSNKCKEVINKIDCLHSIDSLRLIDVIDKYALKAIDCFIEVNTSNESTKNGIKENDLAMFVERINKSPKLNLIGLMTIAIASENQESVEACFLKLSELLQSANQKFGLKLKALSMGMSDDYGLALKHQATHLRLGRILIKKG